ncbi:MAG: type II secretion system F family protein [Ornithinimicrobium sp.]
MSEHVLLAPGLLLFSVLLWPSRGHIQAAAAGAAIGARRLRPAGPERWWNRDLKVDDLLKPRRPSSVPVGFLDSMMAGLRAGLAPADALKGAARDLGDAPAGQDAAHWLDPILSTAQAGRPLGTVWQTLARRRHDPDLAALARAWTISEKLGAPLADAVAAAADMARSRTALAASINTATAGARMTSTLLCALPLGGLGVAAVLGIDPLTLYSQPLSMFALATGALLLLLGRWWVGRMIRAVAVTP